MGEGFLNCLKVFKDIRMIKFQIVDDCDFWKIMNKFAALVEKSGVILVSLQYDPVTVC